jgi:hypothetical protein
MNAEDWIEPVVAGWTMPVELAKDHLGARRLFGIVGPTAIVQLDRGVVRELALVKDDVDAAWTDAHALACTGPAQPQSAAMGGRLRAPHSPPAWHGLKP